jgi:hypothetical protein
MPMPDPTYRKTRVRYDGKGFNNDDLRQINLKMADIVLLTQRDFVLDWQNAVKNDTLAGMAKKYNCSLQALVNRAARIRKHVKNLAKFKGPLTKKEVEILKKIVDQTPTSSSFLKTQERARLWQSCATLTEFCEKSGMTQASASVWASRIRSSYPQLTLKNYLSARGDAPQNPANLPETGV